MAGKQPKPGEVWPSFIAARSDLEMTENGKCRCRVPGHEIVPQKDIVEVCAYLFCDEPIALL